MKKLAKNRKKQNKLEKKQLNEKISKKSKKIE